MTNPGDAGPGDRRDEVTGLVRPPITTAEKVQVVKDLARLSAVEPLPEPAVGFARAAHATNTLRGYASDWREFTGWCADHGLDPLPAGPSVLAAYLTDMTVTGAAVGTMSRRLSSIRFAHAACDLPDPTDTTQVQTVWEGIRRIHGTPPEQAKPLMPPGLLDVLNACPTTKTWRTRGRALEPNLAGARDRALLLVGFVGALRRSELAALSVQDITEHSNGLVVTLPRPKTNLIGEQAELVVLPRASHPDRCPVTALQTWLTLAAITTGPVFRGVSKSNRPSLRGLHPESVNDLVRAAAARTGLEELQEGISAHSLRAGFVTYARLRGASDRAIAHQTRHRSLASLGTHVRGQQAWTDNAATILGL